MPSILFNFNDQLKRDEFIQALHHAVQCLPDNDEGTFHGEMINYGLDHASISNHMAEQHEIPQNHHSCCGSVCNTAGSSPQFQDRHLLFVSGKKMAEGTPPEMKNLFSREVTQHSASVEVRAWKNNQWEAILRRPRSER